MSKNKKKTHRLSGYFEGPLIGNSGPSALASCIASRCHKGKKAPKFSGYFEASKALPPKADRTSLQPSACRALVRRVSAWDSINWKSIKHRICQVQLRIFKASYTGNKNKVYWLQNHLIHSQDAKLIAIQKITKFYKNLNNKEKFSLVQNLKIDTKPSALTSPKAKPRCLRPRGAKQAAGPKQNILTRGGRSGGKNSKIQRQARLDFSTIPNQAKQVLVQLALEPEWKAKGLQFLPEKKSLEIYREICRQNLSAYFRLDFGLNRGEVPDVLHAIHMSLGQNRKWIYQANIREYLNTINHDFLLKKINTYPIMELQIRNWLTHGLFVHSTIQNNQLIFSSIDMSQNRKRNGLSKQIGLKQHFSIEYLLVHIALHGLESHLKDFVENLTLKEQTEPRTRVCGVKQHNPENQQKASVRPSKAKLARFQACAPKGHARSALRAQRRAERRSVYFAEPLAPRQAQGPTSLPSGYSECLELQKVKALKMFAPVGERGGDLGPQQGGLFIRYGYDFVIIHESKEIITLCRNEIQQWLFNNLKAKLNPEQFFLKDGPNGFYFLDFQIIQIKKNNKYKVKIVPSKKSQNEFLLKIRKILQKNKAISAYQLIQKLRPIIIDWGNYFKFYDCKLIYRSLTNQILKKIRAWVFRRDPRSSRHKIKTKYFPENKIWIFNGQTFKSNWVLYGQTKGKNGGATRENFLPHLSWFKP